MGARKRLVSILFWVCAGFLFAVNLYGLLSSGLRSRRPEHTHASERTLAVETARGVSASLVIEGLGEAPAMRIAARGLDENRPIRLVFFDPAGKAKPAQLKKPVPVTGKGTVEQQIALPETVFRRYGVVVGRQGGKVVFRAPLG